MTYKEHLEKKKKVLGEIKGTLRSAIGKIESEQIETQAHSLRTYLSAAIELVTMYMDMLADAHYEIKQLKEENEELKTKLIKMI